MRPIVRLVTGIALGLGFAAAAVTTVASVRADMQPPPAAAALAPSAEEAVRSAVESAGDAYVGDCAATVSPRDAGKTCSRLVAERNGVRAYLAGRCFSEFSRWVFVASEDGGWRTVGVAVLDFFGPPEPPWP
jgi:hypothetical protein